MIKFNVKNMLLATTALCAVNSFPNTAKAEYVPTQGVDNAAYTISEGTASSHKFKILAGYDENDDPVFEYYTYAVKTGIDKASRATSASAIISQNGLPYIGLSFNGPDLYGNAIRLPSSTITTLTGDFIGNHGQVTVADYARTRGGVMYGGGSGSITTLTGDFLGNYVYSKSGKSNKYVMSAGGAISIYEGNYSIETLTGYFIGNYAQAETTAGSGTPATAQGGAISFEGGSIGTLISSFISNRVIASATSGNDSKAYGGAITGGKITTLTGDFINNTATASGGNNAIAYGGANNGGTRTTLKGSFIENAAIATTTVASGNAEALGGAIKNSGTTSTLSGDFVGNYAQAKANNTVTAQGGAIYNTGSITFVADANNSEDDLQDDILFKDNYVSEDGGATKQYEAIYNTSESAVMTFKSVGNGSYTFYDYINGDTSASSQATVNFTAESGTGTLNLYNNIQNQANVNFTGNWNIDMRSEHNEETPDNPYNSITAQNITFEDGKTYSAAIDVNFAENKADKFNATVSSSGIITLNTINLIGTPTEGTVQILNVPTADSPLTLALGSAYASEVILSSSEVEHIDEVTTPLKWSDQLLHTITTTNVYGTFTLDTTNTENDSITLSGIREASSESSESIGDTLALLAHYVPDPLVEKNFNADPAPEAESITYVLGATLGDEFTGIGEMAGTLNINGSTTVPSTLDLNGKTGFVLGTDATALNLNNVTITGNTTVANVTAAGKAINLHNAVVDGNITGTTTYAMAVDGNTELRGTATNANITQSGGKLKMASTSVNSLNVAGGELDIDNNALSVAETTTFGAGTTLSLDINNVTSNFGKISAGEIVIDPTATLNATLAQGLVNIGQTATVQLFSAENSTDFNNFNEVENEMYYFTKNGLNGKYDIKQIKTAEDVVEEVGGSENNAQTAAAWVDGDSFEAGSVEAEIANELSALAQHDPEGFQVALTSLAPEADDITQRSESAKAERLMNSINQRLAGLAAGQISMSSGDELGKGVSVWADIYHGKADVETTKKNKGFDVRSNGAIFGLEKEFAEHKKVGIGYQHESAKIHGYNRNIRTSGNGGFVYGEYGINAWRLSAMAMYDEASYKENKYALGGTYAAHYDVNTFLTQALLGYDFEIKGGNLVPQTGMRYKHLHRDGYKDSAGQKVSAGDMEGVSAVLGVNYAKEFEVNEFVITPEVYVGAVYDIESDKDNAIVSLANGSTYGLKGSRLHRFGTEFDANVKADLSDNWTVKVQYSGELREDYQGHSLSLGLRYNF